MRLDCALLADPRLLLLLLQHALKLPGRVTAQVMRLLESGRGCSMSVRCAARVHLNLVCMLGGCGVLLAGYSWAGIAAKEAACSAAANMVKSVPPSRIGCT